MEDEGGVFEKLVGVHVEVVGFGEFVVEEVEGFEARVEVSLWGEFAVERPSHEVEDWHGKEDDEGRKTNLRLKVTLKVRKSRP